MFSLSASSGVTHMEMDITVLGGLVLTVDCEVDRADPDSGFFHDVLAVDILYIGSRKVRRGENLDWLRERIERFEGECLESLCAARL